MPDEEPKAYKTAKVVWQKEHGALQEFILNINTITSIGRESNSDIVLPAKNISKQHAVILWKENKFAIADRGSANGVQVNGLRIKEPAFLKDGDRIEIGDFVLSFYALGEKPLAEVITRPFMDLESMKKAKEIAVSADDKEPLSEKPTMILPNILDELAGITESPAQQTTGSGVKASKSEPVKETRVIEDEPEMKKQPTVEKPENKTQLFEAEPVATEKAREFTNIDEIFTGLLLQQTQIVNEAAQAFKEKEQATKTRLASLNDRLGVVAQEMVEFEQKTSESDLADILIRLTRNPNDVTLLVELAKHSDLIRTMMKNLSTHAAMVDNIKLELDTELAKFSK